MAHSLPGRSIICSGMIAFLSVALVSVTFQMPSAIAATTAPASQPARPTTQPALPRISLRAIGLLAEVNFTVTPDGIFTYSRRENSGPTKSKTYALNRRQITRLAKAVLETLDRPSSPHPVTDHYEKITIGEQTWESNDIDDKFVPLQKALYELQLKD